MRAARAPLVARMTPMTRLARPPHPATDPPRVVRDATPWCNCIGRNRADATNCMGGLMMRLAGPQVNSYIYEITPAGELVREYGAACTGENERVQRRHPARAD